MQHVTVLRSVALFLLAAVAEIGGAWLVWQGVRESRGLLWALGGVLALGAYGFVATLQPSDDFGPVLAAYGGVSVSGSLLWPWPWTATGRTASTCWAPRPACSAWRSSRTRRAAPDPTQAPDTTKAP